MSGSENERRINAVRGWARTGQPKATAEALSQCEGLTDEKKRKLMAQAYNGSAERRDSIAKAIEAGTIVRSPKTPEGWRKLAQQDRKKAQKGTG